MHDLGNGRTRDINSLADVVISANKHVFRRVGILGNVNKHVQLLTVDDPQDGQKVHEVDFPELLGSVNPLGDLVDLDNLAGLHIL